MALNFYEIDPSILSSELLRYYCLKFKMVNLSIKLDKYIILFSRHHLYIVTFESFCAIMTWFIQSCTYNKPYTLHQSLSFHSTLHYSCLVPILLTKQYKGSASLWYNVFLFVDMVGCCLGCSESSWLYVKDPPFLQVQAWLTLLLLLVELQFRLLVSWWYFGLPSTLTPLGLWRVDFSVSSLTCPEVEISRRWYFDDEF